MAQKRSLGRKILIAMIAVVLGMLLIFGSIFALTMNNISSTLIKSNQELSEMTGQMSSSSMAELTEKRLLELASEKAEIADGKFSDFKRAVSVVATAVEQVYDDPDDYVAKSVSLPDPDNEGTLSTQVLYSAATDPNDPRIVEELGLLGNVQDTLMAVNSSLESLASVYFAAESGVMVQADYISAKKYDAEERLMPLEAKERPWYQGAAATGEPFLTPVTRDVHTPRLAIMCGVPVYNKGQLMGVAGGGMYLDDMVALVKSMDLGTGGKACIINKDGQVLFSTAEEGIFAAKENGPDLRQSDDKELADMAKKAADGERGVTLVTMGEIPYYVAYAPLKTVGWSLLAIMPQRVVEAPTKKLLTNLNTMTDKALQDSQKQTRQALYLLLALSGASLIVVGLLSLLLSRQIVKPIRMLTEEVSSMEGDNLDFRWEHNTGDETQMLANSFQSLTERMKDYISDIRAITAERERIGTELDLARRIQESMLPSVFPAFPDRSEFDLYAAMDPAREVGGDFYDFFLIDEDHLCLVIADVSGKGVPGALFMMASKIILQGSAKSSKSPSEILTETNATIAANNREEMFVTAWVGILELSTGKLTAANAGHEYSALRGPKGEFALLKDKHGFVIGGFEGVKYTEYELQMEPGAKLFLYTDGLPEAERGGDNAEMFGIERMLDALNDDPQTTPRQILEHMREAVADFVQDAEQFDDLTMLCVEYKGNGRADIGRV